MTGITIQTPRLLLREWRDSDREAFARINADPEVMRYFPRTLSRADSDHTIERIREHFARHGYGPWAVELTSENQSGECIGCIGLNVATFEAHFTPAVEILWRLSQAHQGRGYATEGARAALAYAFESPGLPEIVSFTVVDNHASRRVMQKIGLVHTPAGDFDHPALSPGHPLQRHVLYRLKNPRLS